MKSLPKAVLPRRSQLMRCVEPPSSADSILQTTELPGALKPLSTAVHRMMPGADQS
jgi:hypothetical protein